MEHKGIAEFLGQTLNLPPGSPGPHLAAVGGGSINDCYQVNTGNTQLFLKVNSATKYPDLFQLEKGGLEFLESIRIIRVPAVVSCDNAGGSQFLLMEWIEWTAPTPGFWETFGEQLATLHCVTQAHFGFSTNNYMGSLPQSNLVAATWAGFFNEQRLTPLLRLASGRNLLTAMHLRSFEKLMQHMGEIFNEEAPALLHGDLWSGNFLCDSRQQPVLVDPAVYFGHRSMDLAMTRLFGGFPRSFYDAYAFHFPLPANAEEQFDICNLYPLLVHLILFGQSYRPQIEATLERYT